MKALSTARDNNVDEIVLDLFDYLEFPPSGCWVWTKNKLQGYGLWRKLKFTAPGTMRVHRWMFHHFKQPLTNFQQFVCHSCDNPSCCNPAHLWLGDAQANVSDMISKGRHRVGGAQKPKLTPVEIKEAQSLYASNTISQRELALKYSVTSGTIWRLLKKEIP